MISDVGLIVKVLCYVYVCIKEKKENRKNCKELSVLSKIMHDFIDANNVKGHRVLFILIKKICD